MLPSFSSHSRPDCSVREHGVFFSQLSVCHRLRIDSHCPNSIFVQLAPMMRCASRHIFSAINKIKSVPDILASCYVFKVFKAVIIPNPVLVVDLMKARFFSNKMSHNEVVNKYLASSLLARQAYKVIALVYSAAKNAIAVFPYAIARVKGFYSAKVRDFIKTSPTINAFPCFSHAENVILLYATIKSIRLTGVEWRWA